MNHAENAFHGVVMAQGRDILLEIDAQRRVAYHRTKECPNRNKIMQ